MVWAILSLALVGLGFAGTALALGIRNGVLREERAELVAGLASARLVIDTSRRRINDLMAIADSRAERISSLYDELGKCGDDETRGRAAVAGIRLLLSDPEAEEAETGRR